MEKPINRPNNINFSSGPCAKRPGWLLSNLSSEALGRSHRSKLGKNKLFDVIEKSKKLLELPSDYLLGILPASDTGAIEMALWNLLNDEIGVNVVAFESFGYDWANDIEKELKIKSTTVFRESYGKLPDLSKIDFSKDVVFTWNGTTSGVCVPDANWIPENRKGLTICDATSAVFAMDIDWSKIDVATYSWQKAMGGEGAHGILILSPRAVARLENNPPSRALPKIFQLVKKGKLISSIFEGSTINTPSMLCVEDAIDSLNWIESIGGLKSTIKRSQDNLSVIKQWISKSNKFSFLAEDEKTISSTSICIKIENEWYNNLSEEQQTKFAKNIVDILEKEKVAFDIASYRDAPAGLRIWGGATIEKQDIEKLLPWIDWAYESAYSLLK